MGCVSAAVQAPQKRHSHRICHPFGIIDVMYVKKSPPSEGCPAGIVFSSCSHLSSFFAHLYLSPPSEGCPKDGVGSLSS